MTSAIDACSGQSLGRLESDLDHGERGYDRHVFPGSPDGRPADRRHDVGFGHVADVAVESLCSKTTTGLSSRMAGLDTMA